MKNFLNNRKNYLIISSIAIELDKFNSSFVLLNKIQQSKNIIKLFHESLFFLNSEYINIEKSINEILNSIEIKINYLLSITKYISKIKLTIPSQFSLMDIKIIELNKGYFNGLSYSQLDDGLIFEAKNLISLRSVNE